MTATLSYSYHNDKKIDLTLYILYYILYTVRGKKVMLDRGIPCRDMGKMSRWVGIKAYGGYTVNPAGVLYSSLPLHKSEGREADSLLPEILKIKVY
jgi:hypothetical protein